MIILFGNVGSGKGTQADLLAKKLNCPTLSSGEILRQHVGDPELLAALNTGKLLSDETLFMVMEPEITKAAAAGEFILDGFPRTVNQAKWLVDKVQAGQFKITAILQLELSEDEAMKRLLSRRRHDDTKAAIKERFNEYEEKVLPTINFLKQLGYKVKIIDADGTIEEVAKRIKEALKN